MKHAPPVEAKLDVVDVGTGPNLIPLFCALPRARSLTVWEYAESNVAWLEAEMLRAEMRPQWHHFWSITRDAYQPQYDLPDNPMPFLRANTVVRQGSIAAFLVRSVGYIVADHPFPCLSLSAELIESVFARHADGIKTERIGIVEREIRSGYSCFVFLTGIAR